jgi:hypothetical protein
MRWVPSSTRALSGKPPISSENYNALIYAVLEKVQQTAFARTVPSAPPLAIPLAPPEVAAKPILLPALVLGGIALLAGVVWLFAPAQDASQLAIAPVDAGPPAPIAPTPDLRRRPTRECLRTRPLSNRDAPPHRGGSMRDTTLRRSWKNSRSMRQILTAERVGRSPGQVFKHPVQKADNAMLSWAIHA